MNNRKFKPFPLPDFTQKCHYTSQIFSCDHREFLKRPRVTHVWPCPLPKGTKRRCNNMANRPKEVVVVGDVCSKCTLAAAAEGIEMGREKWEEVFQGEGDETTIEDWGIAPPTKANVARKEEESASQQAITPLEARILQRQKETIPLPSEEEVGIVALGKEIIKENQKSPVVPGNLKEKIVEARRKLEIESQRKKNIDDWEIIDRDEVGGLEWGNGKGSGGGRCSVN